MITALPSEHILLESTDAEVDAARSGPGALRTRLTLTNRIRRVTIELTFYQNGYLRICEQQARRDESEWRVALRHIDPKPTLSRRVAMTPLGAMLASVALASLMAALAYWSVAPAFTLSAAGAALVTAVCAATSYVYRTEERVQFFTRHGRMAVLTLVASHGCFRACRALVPRLVAEIEAAASCAGGDKKGQLRAEVREHYRLRESGILSSVDCMTAVQRILAQFQ
jgi:hypothetical protein